MTAEKSRLELAHLALEMCLIAQGVFGWSVDPKKIIAWLEPITNDDDSVADLLHDEPLYVTADMLGIDRSKPEFRRYESIYQQFRSKVLGRGPVPPGP